MHSRSSSAVAAAAASISIVKLDNNMDWFASFPPTTSCRETMMLEHAYVDVDVVLILSVWISLGAVRTAARQFMQYTRILFEIS